MTSVPPNLHTSPLPLYPSTILTRIIGSSPTTTDQMAYRPPLPKRTIQTHHQQLIKQPTAHPQGDVRGKSDRRINTKINITTVHQPRSRFQILQAETGFFCVVNDISFVVVSVTMSVSSSSKRSLAVCSLREWLWYLQDSCSYSGSSATSKPLSTSFVDIPPRDDCFTGHTGIMFSAAA
jgi:hypothetical protein